MTIQRVLIFGIIFVLQQAIMAQHFSPTWVDVSSNIQVNKATDVILRLSGTTGWNTRARSSEALLSSNDGWVEYWHYGRNVSAHQRAFGLGRNISTHTLATMEYAVHISGNTANVLSSNTLLASTTLNVGDKVRISKVGNNVIFSVNSVSFCTRSVISSIDLHLVALFRNNTAHFQGLTMSFGDYKTLEWDSLTNFQDSLGVLSKVNNSQPAQAFSNNFFNPNKCGFIEFKVDTSHKSGVAWSWGLTKKIQSIPYWKYRFRMNETFDTVKFFLNNELSSQFTISHGNVIRFHYYRDKLYLFKNDSIILDITHFDNSPMLLGIFSDQVASTILNTNDIKLSMSPDDSYLYPEVSTMTDSIPGSATFKKFGAAKLDKEYLWSDTLITRSGWDSYYLSLDSELKAAIDTITYDQIFGIGDTIIETNEWLSSKVIFREIDSNTGEIINYEIAFRPEIDINSGYLWENDVITKNTTSSHRFKLLNGSNAEFRDGEIVWRIYKGTGQVKFGLAPVGAAYHSGGNHLSHCFYLTNYNWFVSINGTQTSLNRVMVEGDLLKIAILNNTVNFYINEDIVHTATLSGTESFQVEAFFIDNPTNKSHLKIEKITLSNIFSSRRVNVLTTDAACNSGLGSARINYVPANWTSISYSIINFLTEEVAYYGTASTWNNLQPGSYTLIMSYSISGVIHSLVRTFDIGYILDWQFPDDSNFIHNTSSGNNFLSHSTSTLSLSDFAKSFDQLSPISEGWISFEYKNAGSSGGLNIVQMRLDGSANSNEIAGIVFFHNLLTKFSSPSLLGSSLCNFNLTTLNTYRKFKIEWKSDLLKLWVNNQVVYSCAKPIGISYKNFLILVHGKAGLIRNPVASFCGSPTIQFVDLKNTLDEGFYVPVEPSIPIRYIEDYNDSDGKLAYRIYDQTRSVVVQSDFQDAIKFGSNYLKVPIGSLVAGYYILEVVNSKNEIKKLRFKI